MITTTEARKEIEEEILRARLLLLTRQAEQAVRQRWLNEIARFEVLLSALADAPELYVELRIFFEDRQIIVVSPPLRQQWAYITAQGGELLTEYCQIDDEVAVLPGVDWKEIAEWIR